MRPGKRKSIFFGNSKRTRSELEANSEANQMYGTLGVLKILYIKNQKFDQNFSEIEVIFEKVSYEFLKPIIRSAKVSKVPNFWRGCFL